MAYDNNMIIELLAEKSYFGTELENRIIADCY